MTPEERFWSKVNKTDGCWLWTGARTAVGWHGVFAADARRATKRMVVAHRYSWELVHGPVPDGLKVCHACDEPACVRPDHLWLGTQRANMVDASRKGRTYPQIADWSRCKRGHLFRPETTMIHHGTGRRRCRVCNNEWRRATYSRTEPCRWEWAPLTMGPAPDVKVCEVHGEPWPDHRKTCLALYRRHYGGASDAMDRAAADVLGEVVG